MLYRFLDECRDKFLGQPSLAVDIETSYDPSNGVSGPWVDRITVISVANAAGDVLVDHCAHTGISQGMRELLSGDSEWITHNGTNFDLLFFDRIGIPIPKKHHDTLIAEQVLDTQYRRDNRKDLATTIRRRLGRTIDKGIDHRLWMRRELTSEQLMYAMNDVLWLHKLRDKQMAVAKERNLLTHMKKEMELSSVMAEIIANGWAIDLANLGSIQQKLFVEAEQSIRRVKTVFGRHINVNSPKQMGAAIERKFGVTLPKTKTGAPSTDKEALNKFASQIPILNDILTWRAYSKRTEFYDDEWIYKWVYDNRIHAMFRQCRTETLRFSCADPNMQQIPRTMREMIGGEEGLCVVQADYGQIELRIGAYLAQDTRLMEIVEEEDIHSEMAAETFPESSIDGELRSLAKRVTFGWEFGGGGIERILAESRGGGRKGLTEDEARAIKQRLDTRFPQFVAWKKRAGRRNSRTPTPVVLPWGAMRYVQPERAWMGRLVNTKVQGSTAIGMKEAILEIDRRRLTPYISGTVHDEIVATSVPEADAAGFAAELSDAMKAGMYAMMDDWNEHNREDFEPVKIVVDPIIGTHWVKG